MTMSEHPTPFDLQCLSVDAVEGGRHQEVRAHVDGCEQCQTYVAELEHQSREMLTRKPAPAFAEQVAARASSGGLFAWLRLGDLGPGWAGAAGAVAAIAIVLVVGRGLMTEDPQLRMMGGAEVLVHIMSAGDVRLATESSTVTSGDAVRFTLRLPSPGYAAVFFLDAQGEVGWLVPSVPAGDAMAVKAGETVLPNSATFDDSKAPERAFVVVGTEAFSPRDAKDRLLAARSGRFEDEAWIPEGVWTILFTKN